MRRNRVVDHCVSNESRRQAFAGGLPRVSLRAGYQTTLGELLPKDLNTDVDVA
jgi:hypothetical protein